MHTKVPAVETSMAAAPRAAQWLTAADGTRHPLIEVSSDSSDDEVAVGGLGDVLAPLDPAAAQAGDAGEDGEGKVAPGAAGARSLNNLFACIEKTPAWSKLFMRWPRRER